MTVANGFQIVSIDRVFTILSYNVYSYILAILNNIVKYMVYKTSFFRYLYDDLYHTF